MGDLSCRQSNEVYYVKIILLATAIFIWLFRDPLARVSRRRLRRWISPARRWRRLHEVKPVSPAPGTVYHFLVTLDLLSQFENVTPYQALELATAASGLDADRVLRGEGLLGTRHALSGLLRLYPDKYLKQLASGEALQQAAGDIADTLLEDTRINLQTQLRRASILLSFPLILAVFLPLLLLLGGAIIRNLTVLLSS